MLLAATSSWGQGFGRFGYSQSADLPGLILTKDEFHAKAPGSASLAFAKPGEEWTPLITSEQGQTVHLNKGEDVPEKAAYELFNPGIRLYFPKGFSLGLACEKAPYLTWTEGSVGDGVPTPNEAYFLLSFQDDQPAWLIQFDGAPPSLTISGKEGNWTLRTEKPYSGWVRCSLPLGDKPSKTVNAATLGQLWVKFSSESAYWLAPPAKFVKRASDADSLSVTGTWSFDRPGVRVPAAISMAQLGGYPISQVSRVKQLQGADECGPIVVTDENDLVARFPLRRVPTGKFIADGKSTVSPPATVSSIDAPSVFELGLENLASWCDGATRKLAETTLADYFDQTNYFIEPVTGQQLPYDAGGHGLDLAGAQAFLMQALTVSKQPTGPENSLLTSILWRQDFMTWQVWTADRTQGRRAASLAALAGAIASEPDKRLAGAMLQAGLSCERGLAIYRKRLGQDSGPGLLEPMEGMRQVLFALNGTATGPDCAFARAMLSELRLFGPTIAYLERQDQDWNLVWDGQASGAGEFALASAYPITLVKQTNLAALQIEDAFGITKIRYRRSAPGACQAKLSAPSFAKPIPPAADSPEYQEVVR